MRKILLIALMCVSLGVNAQNINYRAFDTNGPLGECLFPQDENGNIAFSEIIPCTYSADTIMGLAKEYMYDIGKRYNADCKIELNGLTKIACKVKLPIGKEYFPLGSIYTFERSHSEISFDMVIEVKEGKYRYTLDNFFTQRRRIPGEGKSDGQSNIIHWQRVNSLKKEMPKKGSKRDEYLRMIEDEKATYQAEYNAIQNVLSGLREFTVIKDDF